MQLTDRVSASDDVVAREVAGETVLLNLASGTYFGLNAVGGRIWQLIDGQPRTLADIAGLVAQEFAVGRERAEADVLSLANDMAEHGLLRRG